LRKLSLLLHLYILPFQFFQYFLFQRDRFQCIWMRSTPDFRYAFITGLHGTDMKDLNSLVDLPDEVILTGQVIAHVIVIPEPRSYALM
jgi:hypothetical protein